jgi:(S)-ureidoglycine aminohydrolase
MVPFGFTRTSVQRDHAFIAPDSHVKSPLPGWEKTAGIVLISPRMGARFTQFLAHMEEGGQSGPPLPGVERFVYVLKGEVQLSLDGHSAALTAGGYAFIPPDTPHVLATAAPATLNLFERRYVATPGHPVPAAVVGHEQAVEAAPFMDDPDAMLKTLLPDTLGFDMAVNLFAFTPGAALPMVEVHVMEHGMLLTQGNGIYRLNESWYPIQAGDVIWMGPYCPQWFAAVGKAPAQYLYYKDMNRDPLLETGA